MDPGATPSLGSNDYPAGYETDVVLSDGATAHVRPIVPEDAERILDFHGRQSPESIYFRYFSPRPRLTPRDVERLTTVDYHDRMALIALRGDELIGVARYDRLRQRSEAEVAFFVDEGNRGRGLATVLLEHLAVRAREIGIAAFTASVLPQNRRMINVFTAAGFQAATRFADGVVEVRLGLDPTPEAEAAIAARARQAASEAVRRLLSPRSVAVIGASRTPGTIGHEVFRNLQRAGFQGPVWPVNPHAEHLGATPVVASILDLPDDVDLAIVVVPAEAVASVVEECGRKQVYGVVVLSSGFAEAGPAGVALEAEVLRVARSWGIRLVGPNCLGVLNTDPSVRLRATFAEVDPRPGEVSLLSESGMVGAAIMAQARQLGIGISSFVALGNRADVSGNDLLQYWEADEATRVVCMYIESFGNARRFSRLARRLARSKPVIVVKSGISFDPTGQALLQQTGVVDAPTLRALLETTQLLVSQPLPRGRRVAVLGNAGGSLEIAADAARWAGLELALLDERSGLANPHDLGLRADQDDIEHAVAALAGDTGVDAVLVLYAPSLGAGPTAARAALDRGHSAHPDVPVAACFYGPDLARDEDEVPGRVPVFDAIDAAARALGRLAGYVEWRSLAEGTPVELDAEVAASVRSLVHEALERGDRRLQDADLMAVLDSVGLVRTRTFEVSSRDAALSAAGELGYPVVLKAVHRSALAKTIADGFALDLVDEAALRSAWERMGASLGSAATPAVVQPMVPRGVDVAIEVQDHPEVGPVLSLGPGGASAALDQAVDLRVLPLTDLDAHRLVEGSRLAPVLSPAAFGALERTLLRIGALVEEVPELVGLRANPVIVADDGTTMTDVWIDIAPVDHEPLPPLRRVDAGE